MKQLGNVCDVVNGGTPKTGIQQYWSGNHLWITPAEMGKRLSPYVDDTIRKITDLGLQDSSARMLPPNSVILSSRAPIGHLVINTKPMATNQGCKGLIPSNQIQAKFLYYYMGSIVDLLNLLGTGTTFKELSGSKLKEVPIPVPPLPEQHRIVRILDEAFASIATAKANAEANLRNARAVFDSYLQGVFTQRGEGWVDKQLGELVTFRNGINFTKSSQGESVEIFGVKNFQANFWAPLHDLDTVITDGVLPDSNLLKENDLLFVRSNGNMALIGRSVLVGEVVSKVTHSGFTIRARLNDECLSARYLCHFLKSNTARQKMIDDGIGTNIKSLNQMTLSTLVVPVPPTAEQMHIADQLEAVDEETHRLTTLYQQKLAALDALKKSLLHQAFSGQL